MPESPVTHYVVVVTRDSGWTDVLGVYPITVPQRTRKITAIKQALETARVSFAGTVWARCIERDQASPVDVGPELPGPGVILDSSPPSR